MLLSYSKIWLSGRLMDTDVAEDPYLGAELTRYFPKPVQRRYPRAILGHQLSREIIVTATTNSLVNRMGPGFAIRTQEDTGADVGSIARAYSIAREITGMRDLWADIEALDDKVPAAIQYAMSHESMRLLRRLTYWVLRNLGTNLDIERAVSRLRPGIRELMSSLPDLIKGIEVDLYERSLQRFSVDGVPASVARRVASLGAVHSSVDIVEVALARRAPVAQAARVYFGLGAAIGLDWIRGEIERLPVEGHWQALARGSLREEAYMLQRRLADQALSRVRTGDSTKRINAWLKKGGAAYENLGRTVHEMRAIGKRRLSHPVGRAAGRAPAGRGLRDRHARPARAGPPWPEHLEPREPVHRLARRRPDRPGPRRSPRRRRAAAHPGLRVPPVLHFGAEARDPHALDRPRRDGPHVGARRARLAPERASLRRAAGPRQGRDDRKVRRRPGQGLAAQLRHPAAAARGRRSAPAALRRALRRHRRRAAAGDRVAQGHARARRALVARATGAGTRRPVATCSSSHMATACARSSRCSTA